MSRVRKIAIGVLAVLLVGAPFVPRGGHVDGVLAPSGDPVRLATATAATAGPGRVTPEMAAEIDRVVDAGRLPAGRPQPLTIEDLTRRLVRCATFEGQRYCLGVGWTHRTAAQARARLAAAARAVPSGRAVGPETTGDLDALAALRRAARLDPEARAAAERRELTAAARSVAKVWLLRHEVQGVPLPTGFLARHPEARATTSAYAARPATKTRGDYPRRGTVLRPRRVSEQRTTYWCGPASMQMIAWGWQDERRRQRHWARRLGTTTDGTAIWDMVRVVNRATGYDRAKRAGPYIVLDISDWSFKKWLLLQMRHVVDYRAPLVLHPVLLKRYYPYLDDDASGHFQVGRGYDKRGDKPAHLGFFEPWNQQRFDPSEPHIARVQWRSAYKSYRGNRAHFQQNIGV